jgi:hypothetical protein
MFHSVRFVPVAVSLAALLVTLALAPAAVEAQVEPFRIRGEGVGPEGLPLPGEDPRPHWIIGNATHLGLHHGEGSVRTDTADFSDFPNTISGEFGSGDPFVFVAANGDKLACHYGRTDKGASQPGTFVLKIVGFSDRGLGLIVEAAWIAEFAVQTEQCTGKFAGVKGSWVMFAFSEPFVLGTNDPVYYGWEGEGELRFTHGKLD